MATTLDCWYHKVNYSVHPLKVCMAMYYTQKDTVDVGRCKLHMSCKIKGHLKLLKALSRYII